MFNQQNIKLLPYSYLSNWSQRLLSWSMTVEIMNLENTLNSQHIEVEAAIRLQIKEEILSQIRWMQGFSAQEAGIVYSDAWAGRMAFPQD